MTHINQGDMMVNNSYMVVDRETGVAVYEFWNPTIIDKINQAKYRVMTAYEYLTQLNKKGEVGS